MVPLVNYIARCRPASGRSRRPSRYAGPVRRPAGAARPDAADEARRQRLLPLFPEELRHYKAPAQVAATDAQLVMLGSTDVPMVAAFMQAFEQDHYNPKLFVAASGPDQGAAFTSAVGRTTPAGSWCRTAGSPGSTTRRASRWSRSTSPSTAARLQRQRRRGRGLLRRPGDGPGSHRHRRHRQREDHPLPAQRRPAAQRAGPGDVRRPRRERAAAASSSSGRTATSGRSWRRHVSLGVRSSPSSRTGRANETSTWPPSPQVGSFLIRVTGYFSWRSRRPGPCGPLRLSEEIGITARK